MSAKPLAIPRLPVISWRYFFDRRKSELPSVLAAGDVLPTTSGRAAIALALRAIGCRAGDHVLVPTYHCPTMVAPIAALSAVPVFFPIDDEGRARLDWLPDEAWQGVKAAIVPHYFGVPREMASVRDLCDAHGVALIEDCAHAFFGRAQGRPIGSWGDFAIGSLTKFFPVTEGGCLVSARRHLPSLALGTRPNTVSLRVLADALEIAVTHGRLKGLQILLAPAYRAKQRLRGTAQPSPLPAASLSLEEAIARARQDFAADAQPFRRIAAAAWRLVRAGGSGRIVERRQQNYRWLGQRLAGLKGARPLQAEPGPDAAPYVFPLWVDNADEVYQAVRASGVPVFRWDDRWPQTPTLVRDAGGAWAHHVFQIGCHQDLADSDLEWIAQALERLIDGPRG